MINQRSALRGLYGRQITGLDRTEFRRCLLDRSFPHPRNSLTAWWLFMARRLLESMEESSVCPEFRTIFYQSFDDYIMRNGINLFFEDLFRQILADVGYRRPNTSSFRHFAAEFEMSEFVRGGGRWWLLPYRIYM
jgi:hypothetical protein